MHVRISAVVLLKHAGVQALLPVLREMGEPDGHPLQQRMELRLALIAAAPWRRLADKQVRAAAAALPSPAGTPAKPAGGAEDPAARAAAEAQADALVMLAWKFVFGRPYGSDHPVELRRACVMRFESQLTLGRLSRSLYALS